jgi:hypothetical protein
MLFILYPALILAIADMRGAVSPLAAPPVGAASEPTFDPDAPPKWWTDKMRQPCTQTGDRIVC